MPLAVQFFVHYAYGILFGWVLVEQMGLPIPSIPLLLTAGTLSATHQIQASLALGSAVAACLLADSVWYLLGRRFGGQVLRLLCRLSLEASTCVAKTEGYFHRRGPVTLLFAKFIPGLSTLAAPIAGQTGMPYGRFALWDLAGSIVWAEAYLLAGRFFGDFAKRSARLLHLLSHFAFGIFVLLVVGFLCWRVWKNRKFLLEMRELRMEPSELSELIQASEDYGNTPPFVVDLRHPMDILTDPRVIPGAVRVSPTDIVAQSKLLPRDRDVVLYCTCPNEETSARIAKRLLKAGVHRVRPLKGGFEGWRDHGFPLVAYVESPDRAAQDQSEPALAS